MRVKLIYYKPSGKFYGSASYETSHEDLNEIWAEVRKMLATRTCPDLCLGHSMYLVSVEVPDHENNHPKLIIDHDALGWRIE